MEYAILLMPRNDLLYWEQAPALAIAELQVLNQRVMMGKLAQVCPGKVGDMPCISFQAPELGQEELKMLAALSFYYGAFARAGELLRPLGLPRPAYFPEDILSYNYTTRANGAFTAMLYNVTLWSGAFAHQFSARLRVLAPFCGRGAMVRYGLYRGHDVDGLELDKGAVQALDEFLSRYLKEHRFKHSFHRERFKRRQGGMGRKFLVQGAPDKERAKEDPFACMVVGDDSAAANNHYAKNTYHAIATELPRWEAQDIQGMLQRALPAWVRVLKPGGSLGLTWDLGSISREALVSLVSQVGLKALEGEPYWDFAHQAGEAARRDLVVAQKL